jgi:hypothetical protein
VGRLSRRRLSAILAEQVAQPDDERLEIAAQPVNLSIGLL